MTVNIYEIFVYFLKNRFEITIKQTFRIYLQLIQMFINLKWAEK